jgi:hypothetical protein
VIVRHDEAWCVHGLLHDPALRCEERHPSYWRLFVIRLLVIFTCVATLGSVDHLIDLMLGGPR